VGEELRKGDLGQPTILNCRPRDVILMCPEYSINLFHGHVCNIPSPDGIYIRPRGTIIGRFMESLAPHLPVNQEWRKVSRAGSYSCDVVEWMKEFSDENNTRHELDLGVLGPTHRGLLKLVNLFAL
jgi:hypothetical protein